MPDKTRRYLGAAFGAGMGLLYALVAQSINPLILPDIPLYQPPPGTLMTILFSALLGGLLGLVAAWFEDAVLSVIASAVTGIIISTLYSIYGPGETNNPYLATLVVLIFTFLPRALLFVPLAILVRWLLSKWNEELQSVNFSTRKILLSLVAVFAIAALTGLLSIYPQDGRKSLRAMNGLIQAGLESGVSGNLPSALQAVEGFPQEAQGRYTLELSDNPEILNVPSPASSSTELQYAVLVRFESGFRFGCVFYSSASGEVCSTF